MSPGTILIIPIRNHKLAQRMRKEARKEQARRRNRRQSLRRGAGLGLEGSSVLLCRDGVPARRYSDRTHRGTHELRTRSFKENNKFHGATEIASEVRMSRIRLHKNIFSAIMLASLFEGGFYYIGFCGHIHDHGTYLYVHTMQPILSPLIPGPRPLPHLIIENRNMIFP